MKFEKLMNFQRRCINHIKDQYTKGAKNKKWILLNSPTSTGKSYVGLFTLLELLEDNTDMRGVYITYTSICKSDIELKINDLRKLGYQFGTMEVHTMKTLHNSDYFEEDKFVVVFDEAHHLTEEGEYRNFLKNQNNIQLLIGMTGTPRKSFLSDGFHLIVPIYRSQTNFDYPEQISKKIVFNANYVVNKLGRSEDFFEIDNTNEGLKKLGNYINKSYLIQYITEEIYNKSKTCGQSLIICNSIIIAEELMNNINTVFNSAHKACCITSRTPMSLRASFIEAFKEYNIQFLIGVDALSEGFDVPNIKSIFIFENIGSDIRYSQIIGRGMRPDEGKNKLHIYDYRDCFEKFHHVLSNDDYLYKSSNSKRNLMTARGVEKEEVYHYDELKLFENGTILNIKTQIDHNKMFLVMNDLMGIDSNALVDLAKENFDSSRFFLNKDQVKSFLINITSVLKDILPYVDELSDFSLEEMENNFDALDNSGTNVDCTPRETQLVKFLVTPLIEFKFNIRNCKREHILSNQQRIDLYFSADGVIYIFEFAIDLADSKLDQVKNYSNVFKKDRQKHGLPNSLIKLFIVGCSYNRTSESRIIENDPDIEFLNWFDFFFSYVLEVNNDILSKIEIDSSKKVA